MHIHMDTCTGTHVTLGSITDTRILTRTLTHSQQLCEPKEGYVVEPNVVHRNVVHVHIEPGEQEKKHNDERGEDLRDTTSESNTRCECE
jgi:hypothetical protein